MNNFFNLTDNSVWDEYNNISNASLNFSSHDFLVCPRGPPNHVFFQLANIFLFFSYISPNGIWGILWLRSVLCLGSVFFMLWGYFVICAIDIFLWNTVFAIINFIHVLVLFYSLRPVKFHTDLERAYKELFKPLHVSRAQFKELLEYGKGTFVSQTNEFYAVEGETRVEYLSLVLSGQFSISKNEKQIYAVEQFEFLDSSEWLGLSCKDRVQVSIQARADSVYFCWSQDKLKLLLSRKPFLQAVFDHIIGRDVVKKLVSANEAMVRYMNTGNQHKCKEFDFTIINDSENKQNKASSDSKVKLQRVGSVETCV